MTDGLDDVYGGSLALLTDLYQLTMACGYWKAGVAEREAVFHLTFRRPPFGGGYAIAGGHRAGARVPARGCGSTADDLAYLATLRDADGAPLFPRGLPRLPRARCASRAASTRSPRARWCSRTSRCCACAGRSSQAQLVETALLTLVNFQTLVATKAARVVPGGARRAGARVRPAARAGHRRRRSARRARRTSAAARRPRTCSPASCSASRSRARTRTAG